MDGRTIHHAAVPAVPTLAIAGAAGGVGTSMVALAAAAVLAWAGRRVVVIGPDRLLRLASRRAWTGPGADELARLNPAEVGREFTRVAQAVPAIAGLWLLRAQQDLVPAGLPVDITVIDRGVVARPLEGRAGERRAGEGRAGERRAGEGHGAIDWIVARPDQSLTAVLALTAAAGSRLPVVLNGRGPCTRAQAERLLGARVAGVLPYDARVAQMGLQGSVPQALPGTFIAAVRNVLQGRRA